MEYFRVAEELFSKKQYALSAQEYTKCIDTLSKYQTLGAIESEKLVEAYNNRGQAEYRQVLFFEAISDFTSAIKLNPEYFIAFYNRGLIHYRLGQYTLAIKDFEKTLQIQPDFRDASLAISTSKLEQAKDGDRPWPGYLKRIES